MVKFGNSDSEISDPETGVLDGYLRIWLDETKEIKKFQGSPYCGIWHCIAR